MSNDINSICFDKNANDRKRLMVYIYIWRDGFFALDNYAQIERNDVDMNVVIFAVIACRKFFVNDIPFIIFYIPYFTITTIFTHVIISTWRSWSWLSRWEMFLYKLSFCISQVRIYVVRCRYINFLSQNFVFLNQFGFFVTER